MSKKETGLKKILSTVKPKSNCCSVEFEEGESNNKNSYNSSEKYKMDEQSLRG